MTKKAQRLRAISYLRASPSWAFAALPCVALIAIKSFNTLGIWGGTDSTIDNIAVSVTANKNVLRQPHAYTSALQSASITHVLAHEVEDEETTINTTSSRDNRKKRRKRINEAGDTPTNIAALVESIPPSSFNFTEIVVEQKLARPFTFGPTLSEIPGDRMESWCIPYYSNRRSRHGLLFNKMPKAASSTMSGIALRIGEHYASRHYPNVTDDGVTTTPCNTRVGHVPGHKAGQTFGNRDRAGRSFLFSTLRDPARRALSRVYFTRVSQGNGRPTTENILDWLRTWTNSQYGSISPGMGGFQLAYLAFRSIDEWSLWTEDDPYHVRNVELVHDIVREIMLGYDLLMLVERFDESLVVMQLLLGLEVEDILYLSSKHAGDYYYSPRKNECIRLAKTESLPIIDRYLISAEWFAISYGDYVLYEAVDRSLDLTIDSLGRKNFEDALDAFLKLKILAEEQCATAAVFPCSSAGEIQLAESSESCYDRDWGCGYPCLDTLQAVE